MSGVGLLGSSKGGDISLSMASFLPHSKVAAVALVNSAISSMGGTTSYKGTTIPAHGFRNNFDLESLPFVAENTVNVVGTMAPIEEEIDSRIPFEKSKADLMFVAGEDDLNWDSIKFARIAKSSCENYGKMNVDIVTHPGMGHYVQTPFAPVCTTMTHALLPPGLLMTQGGTNKKLHSIAEIKTWKRIISFFKKSL